jgi:hypothetical protein
MSQGPRERPLELVATGNDHDLSRCMIDGEVDAVAGVAAEDLNVRTTYYLICSAQPSINAGMRYHPINPALATLTAASTCSGAVPPG